MPQTKLKSKKAPVKPAVRKDIVTDNPLFPILREAGVKESKAITMITALEAIAIKTSEWEEKALITVAGPEDVQGMKRAKANRLAIKNERLDGEKFCDSQRTIVQATMADAKAEDTGWLRIKQYLKKSADDHEESLLYQEKTKERYEQQLQEELHNSRFELISPFCENPSEFPLGTMSEDSFKNLLAGFRLAKEKAEEEERLAEEARLQKEKEDAEALSALKAKEDLLNVRKIDLAKFGHLKLDLTINLETTEEEFSELKVKAVKAQTVFEKEQKELRDKTKQLEAAEFLRKKTEALLETRRKKLFALGLSFNGTHFVNTKAMYNWEQLQNISDVAFEKNLGVIAAQMQTIKAENEAEVLRKKALEASALETPIADYIKNLQLSLPKYDQKYTACAKDIEAKFAGFKKWAIDIVNLVK
jgi:hypothetical protein